METLTLTYRVRASRAEIDERAESLLLEQTVELPRVALHDACARALTVGRVIEIAEVGPDDHRVILVQPTVTTADDPAQLLNVLFGNSSLQPDVELEDVVVPERLRVRFGGPRFGIGGLRERVGVQGRALTAAALKPMGLTVAQLAELARTLAMAGIDIIKDDHGLADHDFAPFEARVRAVQQAIDAAAGTSGRRALYVPNLIGTPGCVRAQAATAREAGVRAVLVSPMLIGLPGFHELVRDQLDVPVFAHPAFGGAQRIAPTALLGRLFPLFGADAVIYPNHGGRFSYDRDTCERLVNTLRGPAAPLRPAFPVPAGGIRAERVGEILAANGPDTILLMGASLLQDRAQLAGRARRFVDDVQAAAVVP
jgi:ribulose-bisphosphate carboxylase large chain